MGLASGTLMDDIDTYYDEQYSSSQGDRSMIQATVRCLCKTAGQ